MGHIGPMVERKGSILLTILGKFLGLYPLKQTKRSDQMEALPVTTCSHCGAPTDGSLFCCSACEILGGQFETPENELIKKFSYLDQANFRKQYLFESSIYSYQLYVEGMHCSSCIHLLEKIPFYETSILDARVDYSRSKLALKVTEGFSLARVAALLTVWGYTPHFLKPTDQTESLESTENKKLLKKLAVAGACAGNIMLFVIPVYAGLEGEWRGIFNWLSFILFLPVVFYSGTSFYQGAWNSLRYRTANVDLPITVALISGFLLSTVNLIRGDGSIYYDSTASFIFLILCARYFLKRTQQKFLGSLRLEDVLQNDHFVKTTGIEERAVSLEEIDVGDWIKLQQGQVIPADGVIASSEALMDVSVLNGEPMPRNFEKGMSVLAGSKVLSPEVVIRVTASPRQTYLANLLSELQEGAWKKSKFINLTDKLAQILILTVFTLAIGFFIFYFQKNPQEAFNRALALIVVACPCALAFGSPLALSFAMKKAQEQGILIKNADLFEKILKLKNIFFDKTGTLTEMELKIKSTSPAILTDEVKSIILGLEKKSYHPIAFAIRKLWPTIGPVFIERLEEQLGHGVKGFFGNDFYEFSQSIEANTHQGNLSLSLKKNNKEIAKVELEDPLRPDAIQAVQKLKAKGLRTFLLSGDRAERAMAVANTCQIDVHNTFASLTPEAKKYILAKHDNTCMIGDGTNDALSLRAADVGIAVKGSTYVNLQAADIYFTRGGLTPLLDLFQVANKAKSVLIRNLTFSLLYNFIGGSMALMGLINPLFAAILMPISSAIIITATLWSFR